MFIGHYGPAFGAKAAVRAVPLWVLFVAVQWLDYWWSVLILLGIEKGRVEPGFTEASPLDLYFMPYTHGLMGAVVLSALLGAIVALFIRTNRGAVFLIVAAAVFSHWLCDLLVHMPDMPLWDNSTKVGFGLWRWIWISLPLELVFLVIGAWFYARFVPARPGGNLILWAFVALLAGVEIYATFGPPPADIAAEAKTALLAYTAMAAVAGLVDFTRAKVTTPAG